MSRDTVSGVMGNPILTLLAHVHLLLPTSTRLMAGMGCSSLTRDRKLARCCRGYMRRGQKEPIKDTQAPISMDKRGVVGEIRCCKVIFTVEIERRGKKPLLGEFVSSTPRDKVGILQLHHQKL
jgi:hypothetical protein